MLRPGGPSVSDAFQVYHELKAKGFADDSWGVEQKIIKGAGPAWVRSSGNKVECSVRIWTDFVGDQSFEAVTSQEWMTGSTPFGACPRAMARGIGRPPRAAGS